MRQTSTGLTDLRDVLEWLQGEASIRHMRLAFDGLRLEVRMRPPATTPPLEPVDALKPLEHPVHAPCVGRFTRLATEGAEVSADTIIGRIQLARTSRPVHAGRSGTLRLFAAADGAPVEYGANVAFIRDER